MELNICHLYPDILNLYGDRGNIITMKRRLESRGISVNVDECSIGQPLDVDKYDIFFIGGGQDFEQEVLLRDLASGKGKDICTAVEEEKVFLAICGGYQMLGETLSDPDGVEAGGTMKGMGLLPMDTVFADGKTRTRVSGIFGQVEGELSLLSGVELEGYEIHMGVTTLHEGASPLTTIRDHAKTTEEKQDGAYTSRVYGTYVHGVFDKEGVAEAVIRALGKKKGIDTSEMKGVDFQTFKETQYDILAAALREHLDMKAIYEILEAGV